MKKWYIGLLVLILYMRTCQDPDAVPDRIIREEEKSIQVEKRLNKDERSRTKARLEETQKEKNKLKEGSHEENPCDRRIDDLLREYRLLNRESKPRALQGAQESEKEN